MGRMKAISIYIALIILFCPLVVMNVSESEAWGYSFGGGSGTKGDPYIIEDVWDLQNIRENLTAHYVLGNDIDASDTINWNSGAGFDPIGSSWYTYPIIGTPFTGSLNGQNHTIRGLFINRSSYVGLFGEIDQKGVVKDIVLVDINIIGTSNVGGIAGSFGGGFLTNCHAYGNVSGGINGTGGLIGYNGREITHCSFSGKVSGISVIGGLVGINNQGHIENCRASVSVIEKGANVGGLIGRNYGSVVKCQVVGSVIGDRIVGGLVGENYIGDISQCYSKANVSGCHRVGGLVGWEREGWISNSYAMGSVTRLSGTNQSIGGFVGENSHSQILNSYSTGKVIYNGSINPDNKGFAGIAYTGPGSWMSGNFWDNQTSMQKTTSGIATGKNTSAMKTRETFKQAGWDLKRVWCMNDHVTYPLLRWNEKFPKSNAGPDQIVDEGDVVMFDGSASMDDRGITNYTWIITDEKTVTLYGATNSYKFNRPGIFLVSLYVKNELGNMDEDSVKVIVSDITPPIADAGPDQIVEKGTYVVFDGSQSTDNVGVVHYEWTFFIGEPIKINGILPSHLFNSYGVFEVTLNVTDAAGFWDTDKMNVIVSDLTPPKAVAGNDQNVNEGEAITFDGSQSTDNVGIVNWTWTIYDIDPVILYGVQATYRFNNPGQFVIFLNVTDNKGNWNTDSLIVTVNDITPPVASAGQDRIVDEGTIVIFDGSGSYDNVDIINYTWKFNDGDIITLYGARPVYRFDHPGSFTVTLMVIDPSGHWHSDIVIITVRDTTLPMAVAGSDIYIDQGMTAYFNGSGSYDNVGIAYYNWTFDHGSERVALSGISPIFKFDIPGTFTVILNVTDTSGLWHEDTITVYVTDTIPPVANAGEDRTLPAGIVVIFNGSLSSDNYVIKSHIWTFLYDGEEKTFEGETFEFTFDSGGVFRIMLTVTDQFDNRDNDTVSITVIDTGIVKGIVLDEKGDPVEGAGVEITASNGNTYTTITGSDGSFSIEIFHGTFNWRISKEGYRAISGTSSVPPLEEVLLDLSDTPLIKEKGSGPALIMILIPVILILLIIVGIILFLVLRRKKGEDTEKEEEEKLDKEEEKVEPEHEMDPSASEFTQTPPVMEENSEEEIDPFAFEEGSRGIDEILEDDPTKE